MDADAKKTALRMIPYGIYVLTAEKGDRVAAATVNWVTQASFEPPLVVVGVKTDSGAHDLIQETKCFALNVLGKGQQSQAFAFFKPAERDGNTIGGDGCAEDCTVEAVNHLVNGDFSSGTPKRRTCRMPSSRSCSTVRSRLSALSRTMPGMAAISSRRLSPGTTKCG